VVAGGEALLVSARALRAEEFLHLEDSKARQAMISRKAGHRRARAGEQGRTGSRRWNKLARAQARAEAKNRRRLRQAHARAARLAAESCARADVTLVLVGDPAGIEHNDAGSVHNRRVSRWARGQARTTLAYRLEELGIDLERVNERGTSSTCPACGNRATKAGRMLYCQNPACRRRHHRDVAAAQNMIRTHTPDHAPIEIAHTEHRRVGKPARRDRRRLHYQRTTRPHAPTVLPVPGPPPTGGVARPQGEDTLKYVAVLEREST
jgi:IS605 OrfB family transposase